MLRLALQGLHGRKGPFAGAFAALFLAAALVTACGALLQAGLSSTPPVERYAGAPVVVAGSQSYPINPGTEAEDSAPLFERARLDPALVDRIAAVSGVRAAVGDVAAPVRVTGIEGPGGHPLVVHPWSTAPLTPYALRAGRSPRGSGELVADTRLGLRPGARVRVTGAGRERSMTVVGSAATRVRIDRQGVLFASAATTAELADVGGRLDAVAVAPAAGMAPAALAARLRTALGDDRLRVVTGAGRGKVEHAEEDESREAVIAIASVFGSLALLIAMFVVSSTLGLSAVQREREIALLRALGATPRQVRRMVGWEALALAAAATAAGAAPGFAVARVLGTAFASHGAAPEDLAVSTGALPLLVALAATVLTARVAVAAAGRRAGRIAPTRALQEAAAEPRLIGPLRLLAGLGTGGAAIVLLTVAGTTADADAAGGIAAATALVLVISVALLGPLVARAAALAGRVLLRGLPGSLAAANVRTSARRFASAMTPLVLTVALSGTLLFQATTRSHGADVQGHERVAADLVMTSDADGLPQQLASAARRAEGVRAAVGLATTQLGPSLGETMQAIQAAVVDPADIPAVLDLDVTDGSLDTLRAGGIALGEQRARQAHAHVGDRVPLVLGDGARTPARVGAIYRRDLGLGEALLPAQLAAGHTTSPLLTAVLVRTAPGADRAAVAGRLRALARAYPGARVGGAEALHAQADANRTTNDWLFRVLAGIVFAFTAIAVVNTMLMIGVHRTRELGLLRLTGATDRQVRAMARREAGLVVITGLLAGSGVALLVLVPMSRALTGSGTPYAPLALVLLVLGSAAAVGFGAQQLATRIALRARPVDAIGLRE